MNSINIRGPGAPSTDIKTNVKKLDRVDFKRGGIE